MDFHAMRGRALWRITAVILGCWFAAWSLRIAAEQPLPNVARLQSSPVLRHLKPNRGPFPAGSPAEETLKQMYLPDGFRAELVAAEPEVDQPVAFAFDDRGRIWVAEARSYPQKRLPGEGQDQIVILSDVDGDGRYESRKVFVAGLNLVSGLEVGHGGVWVGAAPELLFIGDTNRDDVPDGPGVVLLNGFGYQDTHECLNSFLWGPDGWLYGNQGVFNYGRIGKPGTPDAARTEMRAAVWRYHPVRHEFEIFAEGGSNQWGLDYDEQGQLFMTHCRSYWGRGGTTHVIQGGCFWNQANANYPSYIIANPPEGFPGFRNFLLAAARYDHGAGGAGAPGTDAIYGGHSHAGTMIYLGDNWPETFRGHLFTHNLHGHQINHQLLNRLGSGFDVVHAGQDQFFCSDPKYIGLDLQYGPDGAVYLIDWYDQQHCHNPNADRWERGNGRIYRIIYESTYQPRKVDLAAMSDRELVDLHGHRNQWQVRMARRLLQERAVKRVIAPTAREALQELAAHSADPLRRLSALWTLHAVGGFAAVPATQAWRDPNEYVRAWAVQLAAEDGHPAPSFLTQFAQLARSDPSPAVRLYLASATQRLPSETAWDVIAGLATHAEDTADRNLPLLLWHGLAKRLLNSEPPAPPVVAVAAPGPSPVSLQRALDVAARTQIPQLADYIYWFAATLPGDGVNEVVALLKRLEGETLRRRLAGLELAVTGRPGIAPPPAWKELAQKLYADPNPEIQRQAERLAAVFGDQSMFSRLRGLLGSRETSPDLRRHAFTVLGRAQDRDSLPQFTALLDEPAFRAQALNLLARIGGPEVSQAILDRFEQFSPAERSAALSALTSRAVLALPLLEAVRQGRFRRDHLTAFHIRQLAQLKDKEIDGRVAATWGKFQPTAVQKQEQITRLEKIFEEAPLWAYDGREGEKHFQKLCSSCHRLNNQGVRLGPELTGAGKNGIRYYLENILDPNAVIGTDFQMTTIETRSGEVIAGLVTQETPAALTVRTATGESVLPKSEVSGRRTSETSLMPEGLLDSLQPREQLELLKYLTSN